MCLHVCCEIIYVSMFAIPYSVRNGEASYFITVTHGKYFLETNAGFYYSSLLGLRFVSLFHIIMHNHCIYSIHLRKAVNC